MSGIKLSDGVFYRMYGDIVIVRHVPNQMEYSLNSTAFDVFEILKQKGSCTFEELCTELNNIYEVNDYESFTEDISDFVQEAAENGILTVGDLPHEGAVRESVRQYCYDNCLLFSATLELTYRCNERCVHCYIDENPDRKNELKLSELKHIIDELDELGCMNLLITGGEVTLRDDFLEIARYAVAKNMVLDIYTNGYSLSLEMIIALAEMNVNSISFSFYGGDSETHDRITGIAGSFDRSLKALMLCKCHSIDTYIKTVAIRQNVDTYEKLFELAKELNVKVMPSLIIAPTHLGKSAEKYRLLDKELYRKVIEIERKYQPDLSASPDDSKKHIPSLCGAGRTGLSVDPYGNVFPCNSFHKNLGNIRETTLREIWEKSTFLKKFRSFSISDICSSVGVCENFNTCSICPGSIYMVENDEYIISRDTCMIAEVTREMLLGSCN